MDTTDSALEDLSHSDLVEAARRQGVEVRSRMTKSDLRERIRSVDAAGDRKEGPATQTDTASRVESFRRLARSRAAGDMALLPRMLTGDERRIHVRQTVREDHETRIARHNEQADEKFDKLAGSLYSFFRGTCLLFYRDMAGEDAWMPTVLAAWDIHPENFGVMPNADNVPIFGIKDYDEAYYAPFTWDLKRGATGFMIAGSEVAGHGRGKQRRVAERFVRGYTDAISEYAQRGGAEQEGMRRDNGPSLVRDLIAEGTADGRAAWLASKYHDETGRGFRSSRKLVPISTRVAEFQDVIDRFVADNGVSVPARAAGMRVKDVAERRGQGTASLGLARYYLLIEGAAGDGTDDLVLELKQARRSALEGLVPPSDYEVDGHGGRIAHARQVQVVHGDAFYGDLKHDGVSMMVRERSSFRNAVTLKKLSTSEWKDYAELCGRVLAGGHARSDQAGQIDHDIEPVLTAAIEPAELFVDDVLRFAADAADRVRRDHKMYLADHALGAFGRIDRVYR